MKDPYQNMSVIEYNRIFYPAMNKAKGFIQCLNHALEKSGDEATRQMEVVGWDNGTKQMILYALEYMDRQVKSNLKPELHSVWVDGEKVYENPELNV